MGYSHPTLNPTGAVAVRRALTQPALHEVTMEAVVAPGNMKRAWRRVKSNQGAPGVDGMPIEDFPAYAREHWPTIRQSLLVGRYQPQPVRRGMIPKPGGGERRLGIPCVVDRVIQQALAQVMTPVFDPGVLRVELRLPTQTLRTWRAPSGTGPHRGWVSRGRRS